MLHWVFAPFCLATMAGVSISISIDIEIFRKISIDIDRNIRIPHRNSTISRHSKIRYMYNFFNYIAFTYFILLWSEITEMTRFPRHCYSVTGGIPQSINHWQGRWSMESTTACMREGEWASFWTAAVNNRFFSEPPTVYRRKRVALYVFSVC